MLAAPIQTTLDLGIPLHQVTFCVVDLETTGGSPADCRITEVGAVKYLGGERIGSFQALVNPEIPIPPFITHLTGIDDRSVAAEPPIEEILPAFLEFCRGAVFVAHNARFDFSFLNANLTRLDYDPLPAPAVCTARLARRVVWPDVPNVRLQTLARYFRTRVQPNHRAFADAEACAEVLHGLLDLAGRLGILTLGDLHEAVRARGTAALRQDPPGRPPAARPRRLPVPRPRRARAVRRQVEGPARARQVVLLRRRAQEDRRPARARPRRSTARRARPRSRRSWSRRG